jgi:hypothetical protein
MMGAAEEIQVYLLAPDSLVLSTASSGLSPDVDRHRFLREIEAH